MTVGRSGLNMQDSSRTKVFRTTRITLWCLLALFNLRVLGQVIVALWAPAWLPAMDEWYSGLVPYPILLPIQLLIIGLLAHVCADLTRNRGFFAQPRPAYGRGTLVFGFVYLGAMGLRYVIRMATLPEERWVGGCIPIFMHWGLASFVILFACYRRRIERRHRNAF